MTDFEASADATATALAKANQATAANAGLVNKAPFFTLIRMNQDIARDSAGGLTPSWLHWLCEAASRVRSHISPGPYRSFRELSLAGSVDPVIWCPPTFVGNSGIERSNGHCGFALFFFARRVFP
jgi:hypothetical protein